MDKEFQKILKFFDMSADEKSENLQNVFDEASVFLERFKYVFENGTPEEKQAMMEQVKTLQSNLSAETEKLCQTTGLSQDEIMEFASHPGNFPKDQWEMLQNNRSRIESQAKEIADEFKSKQKPQKEEESEKPKKKKQKKGPGKGHWMPS